jgi:hypothetical protein
MELNIVDQLLLPGRPAPQLADGQARPITQRPNLGGLNRDTSGPIHRISRASETHRRRPENICVAGIA